MKGLSLFCGQFKAAGGTKLLAAAGPNRGHLDALPWLLLREFSENSNLLCASGFALVMSGWCSSPMFLT